MNVLSFDRSEENGRNRIRNETKTKSLKEGSFPWMGDCWLWWVAKAERNQRIKGGKKWVSEEEKMS
jgi:hypothetical protein